MNYTILENFSPGPRKIFVKLNKSLMRSLRAGEEKVVGNAIFSCSGEKIIADRDFKTRFAHLFSQPLEMTHDK